MQAWVESSLLTNQKKKKESSLPLYMYLCIIVSHVLEAWVESSLPMYILCSLYAFHIFVRIRVFGFDLHHIFSKLTVFGAITG